MFWFDHFRQKSLPPKKTNYAYHIICIQRFIIASVRLTVVVTPRVIHWGIITVEWAT